jgi:hypothetical protein
MSCLFGLLGATVVGVDLPHVSLNEAWSEVDRWNLQGRVSFHTYDGSPGHIPGGDYDYIFTKSVLVVIPELEDFLAGLAVKMTPNGELLAVENMVGGRLLSLIRWWRGYMLSGVDNDFLCMVNRVLTVTELKTYYGSVAAVRARNDRRCSSTVNRSHATRTL